MPSNPTAVSDIERAEHDNTYQVKKTSPYGSDGSNLVRIKVNSSGELISAPATNIEGERVSVGTTPVEVTFTGTTRSIEISADINNTGTLYIGKSNVSSDGSNAPFTLEAGEARSFDYDDSDNSLYVVASIASQNFHKGALL